MYILGINCYHNDSSVALIKNGQILNAITEERLNRRKHSSDFPLKSLSVILEANKITLNDISYITLNSNLKITLRKFLFFLKNFSVHFAKSSFKKFKNKKNIISIFKKNFNCDISDKVSYIDHHLSHMNSAFLISNFEESLNVSIDGFGDFKSSSFGVSRNNSTKIYGSIYFPHSLGIFYQSLTQFVGFKNYGDEYKLMGLSAYGTNKYVNKLSNLLKYKNLKYYLNLKYFQHHKRDIVQYDATGDIFYKDLYTKDLEELIGMKSREKFEFSQDIADLSKSTQTVYEEILFNYLNNLQKKYDQANLCLSGGCALNSLANGKIKKNTKFKKIFIPYEPSDAGGSIGSALTKYYEIKKSEKKIFQPSPYLGISFKLEDIKKFLNEKKNIDKIILEEFTDPQKLCFKIATEISNNKIISWFRGKMEFGQRALGNRSILMDARNKNAKEILNSKVKLRENFRPFAPSILIEEAKNWFENYESAEYMTFVYKILEDKRKIIPAVCHEDGTGRLQTVSKSLNPMYHKLINEYYKLTKVPLIINTSFNENEPIVNTPEEAYNTFMRTNLDLLVIENFIIKKSKF
jgi:carbamoyltransferase